MNLVLLQRPKPYGLKITCNKNDQNPYCAIKYTLKTTAGTQKAALTHPGSRSNQSRPDFDFAMRPLCQPC